MHSDDQLLLISRDCRVMCNATHTITRATQSVAYMPTTCTSYRANMDAEAAILDVLRAALNAKETSF